MSSKNKPPRRPIEGLSDPVGYRARQQRYGMPKSARLRKDTYVFTHRPRRRWPLAVFAALLVAAAAFGVWLYFQPVSAQIQAVPADAAITLAGTSGEGTLTVQDLAPGEYELKVERTGFAPVVRMLKVGRFRGVSEEVALEPLPQQVAVRCLTPSGATVTLEAGGQSHSGDGTVTQTVPAGLARIIVTKDGFNTFTRQMFVDATSSVVMHLDPEGQLVHTLGMIECAGAPKGVALTPDGSQAWTTILNAQPSIEIVDPRTGRDLGGINLGKDGAVEIVFNKAGTRAYASQMETARVFEIDVKTRKVLREFQTRSPYNWTKVIALSPDERTLYASNWSGNSVSFFDLETGELTDEIGVAKAPRGLYPTEDGKTLWVASFDTGKLERLDLETGEREEVFTSRGGALRHTIADEKTGRLFTSDMSRDCVWVTDMKTGATKKFVDTDAKPNTIELSPDGRVLFVSCRGENGPSYYAPGPEWGSILLLDAVTGEPLDAIVGGNQCTALDVSDDGTLLVFSDFLDDRLRVYEVPTYETLAKGGGGRWKQHFAELKK